MEAGTPDLIKLEDLDAAAGRLTGRKHVLSIRVENRPGVLAQVAETAEALDQTRAEAGMRRAEEMMASAPHDIDFERARLALLRALQELQSDIRRGR